MSFPLPFCSHSDQQQTVEVHQQPCGIEIECYVPERWDSCKQELDWQYRSICETCEQLRFFVVEFVHVLHVTSLFIRKIRKVLNLHLSYLLLFKCNKCKLRGRPYF